MDLFDGNHIVISKNSLEILLFRLKSRYRIMLFRLTRINEEKINVYVYMNSSTVLKLTENKFIFQIEIHLMHNIYFLEQLH